MRWKLPSLLLYSLANVTQAVCAFLVLPFAIRLLGVDEYGKWSLIEPFFTAIPQIVWLGANLALVQLIVQEGCNPWRTYLLMLGKGQWALVAFVLFGMAILAILDIRGPISLLAAILLYLEGVFLLTLSLLRSLNRVKAFTFSVSMRAITFLAILLALHLMGPTVQGKYSVLHIVEWRVVAIMPIGIFLLLILQRIRTKFKTVSNSKTTTATYSDAIKYGFPLVLTGFTLMLMQYGDRYVISIYGSFSDVAIYTVHVKLAAIVFVSVVTPLGIWWPYERFHRMKSPDEGKEFFRRTSLLVFAVLLIAAGTVYILSPLLIKILAPEVDLKETVLVLLLGGAVAAGMAIPLNVGLLERNRTSQAAKATLFVGVFIFGAFFLLGAFMGDVGIALGVGLGQLIYMSTLHVLSQRVSPVPFPYILMGILLIAALCAVGLLTHLVAETLWWERVAAGALYAVVVGIVCAACLHANAHSKLRKLLT